MANIKSAKKRIDVIERKTAVNKRRKNHIKNVLKAFDKALNEKDLVAAETAFRAAEKELMQASTKNTISKNAASRKVSRLAKKLNEAKASK